MIKLLVEGINKIMRKQIIKLLNYKDKILNGELSFEEFTIFLEKLMLF